jgi:hypothetical protein
MIRILLFLAALAALAFGFSWIADQPGGVALTLAGYRYETSLVAALGFALVILTLAMALWSVARFVFRIPTLMSFSARMRRRNKGFAALTRGMLAAGAGDAKTAATAAREAERLIGQEPLAMLLAAQSAQLSGDRARAERLFQRMADQPETRLLGLRGLHVEARRRGDDLAANDFARLAFELAPAHWAGQAMLERHAMADDWKSALAVVETNAGRKIIDSATANRQLFLAVEPEKFFVVHDMPFSPQQNKQPPITKAPALPRDHDHPLPQNCFIRTPGVVANRHTATADGFTRPPFAHPVVGYEMRDSFPRGGGRHHFFPKRSFKATLSSIASASSRFNRAFSSSRVFRRLASETSIPPYLAFHL